MDNVLTDSVIQPSYRPPQIRAYTPTDHATVAAWWAASGLEPVEPCALSRDGYFITMDGVDTACAWLYVTNFSDVARVEHLVVNPEAHPADVSLAEGFLRDFLTRQATEIGKHLEMEEPLATPSRILTAPERAGEFLALFAAEMQRYDEADCPVTHRFTPGLYIRQIHMPARSLVMSRLHKTEHPYTISKGDVSVWTPQHGVQRLRAPHTGITTPGTQRILFMHEDTIWTTYHATTETDPQVIVHTITDDPLTPHLQEAR